MASKVIACEFSKASGDKDLEQLLGLISTQIGTPEGFTVEQMASGFRRSRGWCRDQLKALISAGLVRFNGHIQAVRVDGQSCLKPVYKVI